MGTPGGSRGQVLLFPMVALLRFTTLSPLYSHSRANMNTKGTTILKFMVLHVSLKI
jgi:hypothetical protein